MVHSLHKVLDYWNVDVWWEICLMNVTIWFIYDSFLSLSFPKLLENSHTRHQQIALFIVNTMLKRPWLCCIGVGAQNNSIRDRTIKKEWQQQVAEADLWSSSIYWEYNVLSVPIVCMSRFWERCHISKGLGSIADGSRVNSSKRKAFIEQRTHRWWSMFTLNSTKEPADGAKKWRTHLWWKTW